MNVPDPATDPTGYEARRASLNARIAAAGLPRKAVARHAGYGTLGTIQQACDLIAGRLSKPTDGRDGQPSQPARAKATPSAHRLELLEAAADDLIAERLAALRQLVDG